MSNHFNILTQLYEQHDWPFSDKMRENVIQLLEYSYKPCHTDTMIVKNTNNDMILYTCPDSFPLQPNKDKPRQGHIKDGIGLLSDNVKADGKGMVIHSLILFYRINKELFYSPSLFYCYF